MVWWWDRTRRKEKFVETPFFYFLPPFFFFFPRPSLSSVNLVPYIGSERPSESPNCSRNMQIALTNSQRFLSHLVVFYFFYFNNLSNIIILLFIIYLVSM
ncbi:hypothetical protein LINGRAHAP2_LOCUS23261, partial [Linum grandiflorum]